MAARLPLPVTPRVRPFAERDYIAYARIRTTGEADRTTPESAREADAAWDWARYEKVRVVAVDEEDAPLGYAEIYHEPSRFDPRRYFLRLAVDLRMRRHGVGALLWTQVLAELEERDARVVYARARDATAGATFLAKRRFTEVLRYYNEVRAVATAPVPTPAQDDRLGRAGIRVATLSDLLRGDADAATKAYDLYYASRTDQATLGPMTPVPFPAWNAWNVEHANALRDGYFTALDGERYVGQTTARRSASDDVLEIGVTGVLPSYRRRGIGRALKLRLHAYARANRYHEIHTTTTRQNTAMTALNDSLGYVIVESYAGYELRLGASIPSSP